MRRLRPGFDLWSMGKGTAGAPRRTYVLLPRNPLALRAAPAAGAACTLTRSRVGQRSRARMIPKREANRTRKPENCSVTIMLTLQPASPKANALLAPLRSTLWYPGPYWPRDAMGHRRCSPHACVQPQFLRPSGTPA